VELGGELGDDGHFGIGREGIGGTDNCGDEARLGCRTQQMQ